MGTVLGILSSKTATEECSQRSSESLPTNQPDSCMGSASPRSVGSYVSKSGQEHSMKELFVGSSSWCPTESPFQGTCTGSHRNQELSRPVWWLLRSVLLRAAGIVASGHSQLDFGKLRPAWKETVEGPSWDAGRIWASLYKAFRRCPRTLIHWFAPFNTVCSRSVWVSSSIVAVKKGEHLLVASIL